MHCTLVCSAFYKIMIILTSSQHTNNICRLQEARLEVLKNLLKQREEHHQDLNTKRLDRLW